MVRYFHSTARSQELNEIDDFKKGCWVHLANPSSDELQAIAKKLNLESDLLHDALDLYESPRVEVDSGAVYIFSRYLHTAEGVINATEPVLFIYHEDCLITVLRSETDIFNNYIHGKFSVATTQKTKTLLQLFFEVNNSYQKFITKTTRHVLKVRSQLKRTNITNDVLLELIELEDDLNEILSALQPFAVVLRNILSGKYIRLYEQDRDLVEDLSLNTNELIELVKSRLKSLVNIRQAYDAIATSDLNRTFKRLTSISIFMTIPTITAGLYGMNLALPLQRNPNAFWIILAVVMTVTAITIYYFQKKRWL